MSNPSVEMEPILAGDRRVTLGSALGLGLGLGFWGQGFCRLERCFCRGEDFCRLEVGSGRYS